MPELVTSLQAAFAGSPGLAVGNVVGSNIANVLLILGVAAAITPIKAEKKAFHRDGAALAIASIAAVGIVLSGSIGHFAGAAFIVLLIGYVSYVYLSERKISRNDVSNDDNELLPSTALAVVQLLGGLALTIAGANLLVQGAIELARGWGVSETVIGLTVVAVGTSLPELTASAMAAFRGRGDIALGNVLGSNIYNILGILGVTALAKPLDVPAQIADFDIWVMVAAALALIAMVMTGWRVSRREGALLLLGYGAYLWATAT